MVLGSARWFSIPQGLPGRLRSGAGLRATRSLPHSRSWSSWCRLSAGLSAGGAPGGEVMASPDRQELVELHGETAPDFIKAGIGHGLGWG